MPVADKAGHGATSPFAMSFGAWKGVLLESWREAGDDNVGIIAAGIAFYGFLALVPLLGAIVLMYGLVAAPKTVIHDMRALTSVMPADAAKLIGEQMMNVVKTSGSKKGFGLLLAIALAVFGARSAAGSVIAMFRASTTLPPVIMDRMSTQFLALFRAIGRVSLLNFYKRLGPISSSDSCLGEGSIIQASRGAQRALVLIERQLCSTTGR